MWDVGIDGGEPVIEIEAIPKPGNSTLVSSWCRQVHGFSVLKPFDTH